MRHAFFLVILLVIASPASGEMYKWVDEKGTIHFTDDLSKIPEKYQSDAQSQKMPKELPGELPAPKEEVDPAPVPSSQKPSEPAGFEIPIKIKGNVAIANVVLNGREKYDFIVDTGASFTSISWKMARGLGITIDENTPFILVETASDVVLEALVTLRSVKVGEVEVENVDVLIGYPPNEMEGLLGNSFLHKFKVVLEPIHGKMTLFPVQGKPSPDRPGGYGKDYWVSRFQFYHKILERLYRMKTRYERDSSTEIKLNLNRVNNAIKYFENQLSELDRKASFAAVPRNWRQ